MEPETNKNKPLTKEETKGLLSLIEKSKIINNKTTNATNNKMKVEEWVRITHQFNATLGTCRRNPQQLRLKWENLKKNSRKRSTIMRMDRIKTGGGPPGYFPPDEILDRVAGLLGSTGQGFNAMFGGDAEPQIIVDGVVGDVCVGNVGVDAEGEETANIVPVESPTPLLSVDGPLPGNQASSAIINENSMPIGNKVPTNSIGDNPVMLDFPVAPHNRALTTSGVKRKHDDWRQPRNKAIAEYYILKKKILEANFKNVMLENEKLKLEIKKLKGEDD